MRKPTILLLERDETLRQQVRTALPSTVFYMRNLHDEASALASLQDTRPALVIIGPTLDYTWDELLVAQEVRQIDPTIPVILVTRHSTEDRATKALKLHLNDYFRMPLSTEDLIASIITCIDKPADRTSLLTTTNLGGAEYIEGLIGENACMQKVKTLIAKAAGTDCNVLITGETGTGRRGWQR